MSESSLFTSFLQAFFSYAILKCLFSFHFLPKNIRMQAEDNEISSAMSSSTHRQASNTQAYFLRKTAQLQQLNAIKYVRKKLKVNNFVAENKRWKFFFLHFPHQARSKSLTKFLVITEYNLLWWNKTVVLLFQGT